MLALEDLKAFTEAQVKDHIAKEYGNGGIERDGVDVGVAGKLEPLSILLAYESVGSWGCDSSSFFLFKDSSGRLYELHGSHCSCYGFENQFTLEETTIEALRLREEKGHFFTGGYDEDKENNELKVKELINELTVS